MSYLHYSTLLPGITFESHPNSNRKWVARSPFSAPQSISVLWYNQQQVRGISLFSIEKFDHIHIPCQQKVHKWCCITLLSGTLIHLTHGWQIVSDAVIFFLWVIWSWFTPYLMGNSLWVTLVFPYSFLEMVWSHHVLWWIASEWLWSAFLSGSLIEYITNKGVSSLSVVFSAG